MTPKKVTTIRIDQDVLEGLEAVKERDGAAISEQVTALRTWLESKGVVVKADASARQRVSGPKPG